MRHALILFSCGLFLFFCLPGFRKEGSPVVITDTSLSDTIDFALSVRPIFEKNCSPCHFPGGKMYNKMPFDKSETILQYREGIFKRMKDEKELQLLKRFLEQRGMIANRLRQQ